MATDYGSPPSISAPRSHGKLRSMLTGTGVGSDSRFKCIVTDLELKPAYHYTVLSKPCASACTACTRAHMGAQERILEPQHATDHATATGAYMPTHPVLTRTKRTSSIMHRVPTRRGTNATPTRRPGHGHPLPRPPVSTSWRRHSASVSKPITRTSAHWPSAHKRSCGQRPAFPGISGGASATRRGAMGGRWHAREVVSSRRVASPTVARARERERLGRDKG